MIQYISRMLYNQIIYSLEMIRIILNETTSENIFLQLNKLDEWQEPKESSLANSLVRYFATPRNHLLEDESKEYYDIIIKGITMKDLPFVIASNILYFFVHTIKYIGLDTTFEDIPRQLQFINYMYGAEFATLRPVDFPDTFVSFEGISYFINTSDVLDLLKREPSTGDFIIDTRELNSYELKPGLRKIGGIGYLKLFKTGFQLYKVVYEDQEYWMEEEEKEEEKEEKEKEEKEEKEKKRKIALYCFYCGVKTYMTITSHLIDSHVIVSAKTTFMTRKYLPSDDPIRRVLLPTEINTLNSAGRALPTLLRKDFCIHNIFSFTFRGLKALIKEHLHLHVNVLQNQTLYRKYMHNDTFLPWLQLKEVELTYLPFSDIYTLFTEISRFVNAFVDTYEEIHGIEQLKNGDEWLQELMPYGTATTTKKEKIEKIKSIIGYMYFLQVRHALMSNNTITYISNNFPSVIPESLEQNKTFYTLTQQFEQFIISAGTSLKWIGMNLDVSNLFILQKEKDAELKNIWQLFYQNMNTLQIQNPLIDPTEISISTGL